MRNRVAGKRLAARRVREAIVEAMRRRRDAQAFERFVSRVLHSSPIAADSAAT